MAKDTIVICKNIFQNGQEETRILAFRQQWLELVRQLEKNSYRVQKSVQTILHEV